MNPSEGEEAAAAALLERSSKRRQRDAHTDELMVGRVPVLDERNETEVNHRQIHLDTYPSC